MSTKTIALENSVYELLAAEKLPSESFTKTIKRLIKCSGDDTCASAVAEAAALWGATGNDEEADQMEIALKQNRKNHPWEVERPE